MPVLHQIGIRASGVFGVSVIATPPLPVPPTASAASGHFWRLRRLPPPPIANALPAPPAALVRTGLPTKTAAAERACHRNPAVERSG